MTTLLDASALLAVLNQEAGADEVEVVLEDAAMSTVNIAEVASKLDELKWAPDQVAETLSDLQLEVIPFDTDAALLSGQLRKATKKYGLSLGDRACLASALITKYTVLTADKTWNKLKIRGLKIRCIR